ncbi:MAG: type II secretion system protein [bacterium]|nr:type II secretion system protein [bacterium]
MRKNQKGFTLIELLVVIAIIGLLSTLAVVALTSARSKARDAKRISDVKQVQTALELYFADTGGNYPKAAGTTAGTVQLGVEADKLCSNGFILSTTEGATCPTTFMGKVPRDPSAPATTPAACGTTTTIGCEYAYKATGDTPTTYTIQFQLEGKTGDLEGTSCATPDGVNKAACP